MQDNEQIWRGWREKDGRGKGTWHICRYQLKDVHSAQIICPAREALEWRMKKLQEALQELHCPGEQIWNLVSFLAHTRFCECGIGDEEEERA